MEKITKRDWIAAGVGSAITAIGIYAGAKIKKACKAKKTKKGQPEQAPSTEKPQAEAAPAANA